MIARIAIAFLLMFGPAAGAQTFLVSAGDCGSVALRFTGPGAAESNGTPSHRVAARYLHLPKEKGPLVEATFEDGDLRVTVPDTGLVMAAVTLQPRIVGNETRTDHAKTFLFCGTRAPMLDWQHPSGIPIEIFPQAWNGPRPHLKAGDVVRFIVVDTTTKTLLRDLPMQLHRIGAGPIAEGEISPHGGMNFRFPEPGRYAVTATYRHTDPQRPEQWFVDTSTLTFDVK